MFTCLLIIVWFVRPATPALPSQPHGHDHAKYNATTAHDIAHSADWSIALRIPHEPHAHRTLT